MSNTETTKPMGTRFEYRDLRFDELIVFFAVLSRLPPLSEKDRARVKKAVENLKKRAVIRRRKMSRDFEVRGVIEGDGATVRGVLDELGCPQTIKSTDCPLVEGKEGVWLYYGDGVYECSECHEQYILDDTPTAHKYHFCPNCGARMEI